MEVQRRRALLEGLAEHIVSEGNKGKKFSELSDEVGKSPITSPAVNDKQMMRPFRDKLFVNFVAEEGEFTWVRLVSERV